MLASLTPAQKLVVLLTVVALALGLWLGTGPGPSEDATAEGNRVTYTLSDAGGVPITVHVVGAVQRPGLYQLPTGSRVSRAVQAAGGFTERADRESVNLAAFVDDGEQVKVDALAAAEPLTSSTPTRSSPTTQPNPTPSASPHQPQAQPTPRAQPASRSTAASGQSAAAQTPTQSELPSWARQSGAHRVRLNHAGLDELQSIDGVGPKLAKNIIYYRSVHGPFASFDDLDNVPEIGPATIEKIRVSATLN